MRNLIEYFQILGIILNTRLNPMLNEEEYENG